ncbi:sugar ABC transporter ATP-binding protein [Methylobacterium indicum]|uniref:Lipase n=1 Tax=Methylobacterium indicum TaxID=1775910 RepID=A0ABR5H3L3_9HYPH|nr:sugar ABC transporter ATP-binding protein [Methylobacterium indicum]KMO15352.1 lipase [Methylobacterium indicum]KMO18197.1 lipase [Methylobacterium indicum]
MMFLEMRGVSKRFGGVQALSNLDFDLARGEIHCLVGGNGSGKSTMIKIISGVQDPDPGARITVEGREHARLTPVESSALGVQVIYQDLSLFPNLTVAENIAIAQHRGLTGLVKRKRMREVAEAAMRRIGVALDLDERVSHLSIANRQLVAICRAIAADAKLVIMDEPTASLTRHEVDALLALTLELKRRDISVLFVSHRFDEVLEIAERVTVIRDGVKLGTYDAKDMTEQRLAVLMSGQSFTYETRDRAVARERPVLAVEGLCKAGEYQDVGFALYPGEILGLTGLLGAGRTELALSLFGMNAPDAGTIRIDGEAVTFRSNRDAIARGIAYVPEDRLSLSLVLEQSIGANVTVTVLDTLKDRLGLLRRRREAGLIRDWIRDLAIKIGTPDDPVRTLSGGNQQRVVIAKWLATKPRVLILDSPTVGVDLHGKDGIYALVKELAAQGLAVIMISDEIPEVLYHCDRILVMREGRLTGEVMAHHVAEPDLRRMVHA